MRSLPLLLVLFAITACSRSSADVSDGAALYVQTCARCHGVDGRGEEQARRELGVPNMADPAWQGAHPDELIKRTVHEGSKSKKMPPFGAVYSDPQLDAIIVHIRRFGHQ